MTNDDTDRTAGDGRKDRHSRRLRLQALRLQELRLLKVTGTAGLDPRSRLFRRRRMFAKLSIGGTDERRQRFVVDGSSGPQFDMAHSPSAAGENVGRVRKRRAVKKADARMAGK